MNLYQQYIHKTRYARYLDEEGRRENWEETVGRYIDFFVEEYREYPEVLERLDESENYILSTDDMPSMRAMMTAGKALDRNHIAGYNCAYLAIDSLDSFKELFNVLLHGTGVGYSVEHKCVSQLPMVPHYFTETPTIIKVLDTKEGWYEALSYVLESLIYRGKDISWDLSLIRPKGSRLKIFGGRASGPEPLDKLLHFVRSTVRAAAGRQLSTLEVHDICCNIAASVVVGGVRRAALICLSDLDDEAIATCKSGEWYVDHSYRALANISAVYEHKPALTSFMQEGIHLFRSMSGERGIFNREAANKLAEGVGRGTHTHVPYGEGAPIQWGCNPCSEIILRSKQFCNLTEVVIRETDSYQDIKEKVKIASFLGVLQSGLTTFEGLSPEWKENTEEERLLGVSFTGICDHPFYSVPSEHLEGVLEGHKSTAREEAEKWCEILGFNKPAAITCVKPSGTVSQLVGSSSGIHPSFAEYYIRRVRNDKTDPIALSMIGAGFPFETTDTEYVFSFPMHSNAGSHQPSTAIEQLELWKLYQEHWCEHKPSQTVFYTQDEFLDCWGWVWKNFDIVSGIAFFPKDDSVYELPPYEKITEEQYYSLLNELPTTFDFDSVVEETDTTTSSQELACQGNSCEL